MPVLHPNGSAGNGSGGPRYSRVDGRLIAKVFLAKYKEAAPYRSRSRLIEAMGHSHPCPLNIGRRTERTDDETFWIPLPIRRKEPLMNHSCNQEEIVLCGVSLCGPVFGAFLVVAAWSGRWKHYTTPPSITAQRLPERGKKPRRTAFRREA